MSEAARRGAELRVAAVRPTGVVRVDHCGVDTFVAAFDRIFIAFQLGLILPVSYALTEAHELFARLTLVFTT